MKRDKRFLTGFTLVEMLVSLALFSVVMVLSASALFFVIEGGRKARSTSSVIGNLNYALENMSRNIRVGSNFHCGDSPPLSAPNNCWGSGENVIAFKSMTGDRWVFKEENSVLKRSTNGGSNFIEMTSDNVVIEEMKFYVKGAIEGDDEQPKVVIIIRGYVESSGGIKSEFNIQTMASQRILDF